jgi:hypothetical protein
MQTIVSQVEPRLLVGSFHDPIDTKCFLFSLVNSFKKSHLGFRKGILYNYFFLISNFIILNSGEVPSHPYQPEVIGLEASQTWQCNYQPSQGR